MADLGTESTLLAQTLHGVPFRTFGVDQGSAQAKPVLDDMQAKILSDRHRPRILQGDFNLHGRSLAGLLPALSAEGLQDVVQQDETTPNGRIYDHVLVAGMVIMESMVVKNVLTDHYPVVTVARCVHGESQ